MFTPSSEPRLAGASRPTRRENGLHPPRPTRPFEHTGEGMDRQQILGQYDWASGICFRHPGKGEVLTAHVKTIRPAAGGIQDIRACEECVLTMERVRRRNDPPVD